VPSIRPSGSEKANEAMMYQATKFRSSNVPKIQGIGKGECATMRVPGKASPSIHHMMRIGPIMIMLGFIVAIIIWL